MDGQEVRVSPGNIKLAAYALPIALFLVSRNNSSLSPLLTEGMPYSPLASYAYLIYTAGLVAFIAFLVMLYFFQRTTKRSLSVKPIIFAACLVGTLSLGALRLCALAGVPFGAAFIAGICLYSLCSAYLLVLIMENMQPFAVCDAMLCVAFSFVEYSIIYLALILLEQAVLTSFVTIALPACIGLGIVLQKKLIEETDISLADETPNDSTSQGISMPFSLVASMLLCLIAASYTRILTVPGFDTVQIVERAFTCLMCLTGLTATLIIVKLGKSATDMLQMCFYFYALFFLASFFLAIIAQFSGMPEYGTAAIKAGQRFFECFALMIVVSRIAGGEWSPPKGSFTYGIAILGIPNLVAFGVFVPLGSTIYAHFSQLQMPITSLVALLAVAIVGSAAMLDVRRKTVVKAEASASLPQDSLLLDKAAQDNGLTARETDIARYLFRGYSVKKIATLEHIATSTVQGHSRNIYRKLNVHSRQELIDLITGLGD